MGELTTIKELETPVKVTRFLYFYDLVFILGYTFIANEVLGSSVHSSLHTFYTINCFVWGIFFILPAVGNPQRKNWQNILNTIINMNTGKTYYAEKREVDEDEVR